MFFPMTRFAENSQVVFTVVVRVIINMMNTYLTRIVGGFFTNEPTVLTGVIKRCFYLISSFLTHGVTISLPLIRISTLPIFAFIRVVEVTSAFIRTKLIPTIFNLTYRTIKVFSTPITRDFIGRFSSSPSPTRVFFSNHFIFHSPGHRARIRTETTSSRWMSVKGFFTGLTGNFNHWHIGILYQGEI